MPEFCTCGAELPPDARFCHKCGKPQREEAHLVEPEAAAPPQADIPISKEPPPAIGFHNSVAVRVGFLAGSLAFLLSSLPFPVVLRMVFLLGAGAFSVFLYGRRSGQTVEVRSGVKMGWITGLFCFVIFTVLFTIVAASFAFLLRDASFTAFYREQMTAMGMSQESIQQVLDLFKNPVQVVTMLFSLFLTSTVFPALGGALGARLLRKN